MYEEYFVNDETNDDELEFPDSDDLDIEEDDDLELEDDDEELDFPEDKPDDN